MEATAATTQVHEELGKSKRTAANALSGKANAVLNLFFILYSIACLLPVVLVLIVSFTSENVVALDGYQFFPSSLSLDAYTYLLRDAAPIARSYGISILTTVVGAAFGLLITAMYAFPLSRQNFPYRSFFSFLLFFTMIFQGGLVPWYLIYTNLFHMKDTLLSLIIPNLLMNAFFVIVMRTFFQTTIHPSIMESAAIDGAGDLRVFTRIVLPLSLPVLATVGLFYTLNYWNNWFNSLVFIDDDKLVNLQYLMYKTMQSVEFLTSNSQVASGMGGQELLKLPSETIRMAMCIVGMGPIVLAYPFFQRYFVQGLTVGAIKG